MMFLRHRVSGELSGHVGGNVPSDDVIAEVLK